MQYKMLGARMHLIKMRGGAEAFLTQFLSSIAHAERA
jgi:hypothetical protein